VGSGMDGHGMGAPRMGGPGSMGQGGACPCGCRLAACRNDHFTSACVVTQRRNGPPCDANPTARVALVASVAGPTPTRPSRRAGGSPYEPPNGHAHGLRSGCARAWNLETSGGLRACRRAAAVRVAAPAPRLPVWSGSQRVAVAGPCLRPLPSARPHRARHPR
jgi:hypothetical protein